MAINRKIVDRLFKHTVSIEPFLGLDSGGTPTYGPAVTYQCHIRDEVKIWKWEDGTEKQSKRGVYLVGENVGRYDRITFPAGYDPRVGTILWATRRSDHVDPYHHTELAV